MVYIIFVWSFFRFEVLFFLGFLLDFVFLVFFVLKFFFIVVFIYE